MDVKNNPAGRLHDILVAASPHPDNVKTRSVWASVFGIGEGDTSLMLEMLAELIRSVSQARAATEALKDIDHGIYLEPYDAVDRVFSQINLDHPWVESKKKISSTMLLGLKFCSDKLARTTGSGVVQTEKLEELRNELAELTKMVLESDLPTSLKALLVTRLEDLRSALLMYQIRGIDGIEEQLERTVGSLVLHSDQISEKVEKEPAYQRILKFLRDIQLIVTTAKGFKELADWVVPMIAGSQSGN